MNERLLTTPSPDVAVLVEGMTAPASRRQFQDPDTVQFLDPFWYTLIKLLWCPSVAQPAVAVTPYMKKEGGCRVSRLDRSSPCDMKNLFHLLMNTIGRKNEKKRVHYPRYRPPHGPWPDRSASSFQVASKSCWVDDGNHERTCVAKGNPLDIVVA